MDPRLESLLLFAKTTQLGDTLFLSHIVLPILFQDPRSMLQPNDSIYRYKSRYPKEPPFKTKRNSNWIHWVAEKSLQSGADVQAAL